VLPALVATQFIRIMNTGRTAPILCACADQGGAYAGEFVIKLRHRLDMGARGLLRELVASRLADHFGILVPEPAGVSIGPEFIEALADQYRDLSDSMQASVGLNFGSRVLQPVNTWLVNRLIPEAMRRDAANIFAFDALIQNPDRRTGNPNLLTQGDSIYVFDHETSFSFLVALAGAGDAWSLERENYLQEHVFFRRLKGLEIDLDDFEQRLAALDDETIAELRAEVPDEWLHQDLETIEAHLIDVRDHAHLFVEQVRRRLA
jgi:hypothetical protein